MRHIMRHYRLYTQCFQASACDASASCRMKPTFWCSCEVTHVRQLLDWCDRIRTREARKSSRAYGSAVPQWTLYNTIDSMIATHRFEYLFVCLQLSCFIAGTQPQKSIGARREQVPFSMAIENEELMQECFPKHLCMGLPRLK